VDTTVVRSHGFSYLYDLISSRVFLSAFFSWFLAQAIKALVDRVKGREREPDDMVATLVWKTGGMPSSHSSLVTALATSIGFAYGIDSPIFTLSLFYGILIIRDALGVRRAAGVQAQVLNKLGGQLARAGAVDFVPVKEVIGHTPSEVSVGVLLGFFIGIAFSVL
jgi:hypothetical protein